MNLILKKAGLEDIPLLIYIEQTVSGSKLYSPMLTSAEWTEALGKNTTYLIEADGVVVGNVSHEMISPSRAYIDGLVVVPDFQGRGIARRAMRMVLQELGFKIESKMENYYGDGEPRVRMVLNK